MRVIEILQLRSGYFAVLGRLPAKESKQSPTFPQENVAAQPPEQVVRTVKSQYVIGLCDLDTAEVRSLSLLVPTIFLKNLSALSSKSVSLQLSPHLGEHSSTRRRVPQDTRPALSGN